jgi:hypothetical protein
VILREALTLEVTTPKGAADVRLHRLEQWIHRRTPATERLHLSVHNMDAITHGTPLGTILVAAIRVVNRHIDPEDYETIVHSADLNSG